MILLYTGIVAIIVGCGFIGLFKERKKLLLTGIGITIVGVLFTILSMSFSPSKETSICSICGGELECEICGKEGLYCENASYGSGTDHYCNEHWGDVVEWHEKR